MPVQHVQLCNFSESELIFDEAETRAILRFFFRHPGASIDSLTITSQVKNFAQGLLIEAVDRTYALGFVELLWQTSYNPGRGMQAVLLKLGRRALYHWFKHATVHDLLHAKVSERIRDRLALSFKFVLHSFILEITHMAAPARRHAAWIMYERPVFQDMLWG